MGQEDIPSPDDIAQYTRAIKKTLVRYNIRHKDLSDLIQDVLAKILVKYNSLTNRSKLGPWIRVVTHNRAIDYERHQQVERDTIIDHYNVDRCAADPNQDWDDSPGIGLTATENRQRIERVRIEEDDRR